MLWVSQLVNELIKQSHMADTCIGYIIYTNNIYGGTPEGNDRGPCNNDDALVTPSPNSTTVK